MYGKGRMGKAWWSQREKQEAVEEKLKVDKEVLSRNVPGEVRERGRERSRREYNRSEPSLLLAVNRVVDDKGWKAPAKCVQDKIHF